jgi:D-3-phosphoglycerate dehydrogenase
LAQADVITLHTPLTDKTRNLFNAATFAKMKPTARLVNVARGGIINEADLVAALRNGVIGGAALDVFGTEPLPGDHPLRGCPRLTITPHLGASTAEAQVRVSTDIADAFNRFFADGTIQNAVNIKLEVDQAISGYLPAAEILGAAIAQIIDSPLKALAVQARGPLARYDTRPLGVAALKGALSHISDNEVNLVNAGVIAEERGIVLSHASTAHLDGPPAQLIVSATTTTGTTRLGGTLVEGQLRIEVFDDYPLDLPLGGHLLLLEYEDRPGMVGKFGTILGDNEINIARMEVSRIDGRGDALVMLVLDDPVPPAVLTAITKAISPHRAAAISH